MRMYLFQRLLYSVMTLLGVIIFIFFLTRLLGDPASMILGSDATPEEIVQLREDWGLNYPLPLQLIHFLQNFIKGDWGTSFRHGHSVLSMLIERLPATLQLTFTAQLMAFLLAVPLGVFAAVKHKTSYDRSVMVIAMIGQSIPMFWLGLILILLFGVTLEWLPISGRGSILHIIMPAMALATVPLSILTRLQRSSLLEILNMDYMKTARAKGLSETIIILKHGLRNAFIPVMTILGIQFGRMFGGAVIIETIFAWPGMGLLTIQAIHNLDFPLIQGAVIMVSMTYISITFLVDLSYAIIDPRVNLKNEI